ncbi:hypothetical protein B0T19DRAFT_424006 [Cercophora scortea]|uniref:Uncharacterized protein n=1 Tax=Cercophora scortea TaxID=314031 RepID=A0AAE0MDB8_9PEZI|nr:hypothetical protein B0T19DRAFT_424006 [Cercophora scortea]
MHLLETLLIATTINWLYSAFPGFPRVLRGQFRPRPRPSRPHPSAQCTYQVFLPRHIIVVILDIQPVKLGVSDWQSIPVALPRSTACAHSRLFMITPQTPLSLYPALTGTSSHSQREIDRQSPHALGRL